MNNKTTSYLEELVTLIFDEIDKAKRGGIADEGEARAKAIDLVWSIRNA